ncbi:response regulator [Candidatus Parcubacteria bacterium]|nr:response regulator [Candidatus Parcubacteria bacterium]
MTDNKKQTILIVEDELPLLNVYADRFDEEGFSVFKANNGQEGLDIAIKEKPDLILLDILMPVMDGLTMMQKLREDNTWGKTVPIILLTNLSADEQRIKKIVSENKPTYYLVKLDWSLSAIIEKAKAAVLPSQK